AGKQVAPQTAYDVQDIALETVALPHDGRGGRDVFRIFFYGFRLAYIDIGSKRK
ncbi:MAG: hypothetical protein JWP88_1613, partial [Flaviaesturariibacter sp.]|nr:hypothetical protein [Flaviaesturariibacter sp.]